MTKALTLRALNRATLARQLLLAREGLAPLAAVERLFALQAQWPKPPFVALWSRLDGFRREELVSLLEGRKLVRTTLLRGTIHLVTAKDYLRVRPSLQPMLSKAVTTVLKERAKGLDLPGLVKDARAAFTERPRTFTELRDALSAARPDADERAMGLAVRMELPLVQVPDGSRWAFPADASFAVAEEWLGKPLSKEGLDKAGLVLRHLSILGPASIAELQAWLGLQGLREVVEGLRPNLIELEDHRGRELFDLPKAPRPDGDTPAPLRFLPEFDNCIVCRADERFVAAAHREAVYLSGLRVLGTVLVDGFAAAVWHVRRKKKDVATLEIAPFAAPDKKLKALYAEEGEPLLRFLEPDAKTFELTFDKRK